MGAAIEVASERAVLADIVGRLERVHAQYVIIANVQIGGRQLDCIVATAESVTVLEVKQSRAPVRGAVNGPWQRLDASGAWRHYGNAYQQALGGKNALRSAMSAVKPVGDFYPEAWVIFFGGIPVGSALTTGDFKVGVTTLADFSADFSDGLRKSPWTLEDWRQFAASLSLTRISAQEAVASDHVRFQIDILKRYNAAVAEEYGREGDRWMAEDDLPGALQQAAGEGVGLAVVGPSGCGKTLMAKWLAARLAAAGSPVFYFAAKDIAGDWAKAVRREIALLTDAGSSDLLRAAAKSDRDIFFIVDGLNELAASDAGVLRGLRALARRYDAKIIITSQAPPPTGFEGLSKVSVGRPSAGLKRRIAERAGGRLDAAAIEFLEVIGSGFEAEMVGGVGAGLIGEVTRLALIDQYVRARLGSHARAGAYGLRHLAVALHRDLAFSMAEARVDDFLRDAGIGFDACDALFAAGLLVRRVGRVSFAHEMLLNASAAFGLAAGAADDPTAFGARLSTPLLAPLGGEIITGIEDRRVCRDVLAAVSNLDLIAAAVRGAYGHLAKSIAKELVLAAKAKCVAEIEAVTLELDTESPYRVRWSETGRRAWTPGELACLGAIGQLATSADGLQDYLDLCGAMDARLLEERARIAPEAKAAKVGLRSPSFALAYYGLGRRIGFSRIDHHGYRDWGREPSSPLPLLDVSDLSSGQLHFYLENRRSFLGAEGPDRFAKELIFVLRDRFSREPYHVQLAALHAVSFAREASEETLAELTQAIQDLDVAPTNWAIGSSVIDALKWLGALDEDAEGAREGIRAEVAEALADGADGSLALSVYTGMIDHPFDSIYCEEFYALEENERHTLCRRALGSVEIKRSISLKWICNEVLELDDPADIDLFARFTSLPDRTNVFPQDEWDAFAKSLRFLGRHGALLPPSDGVEPREICLNAIRVLVFAAESGRPGDLAAAGLAWANLEALPAGLVIGCFSEVHAALTERHDWGGGKLPYEPLDIRLTYPAECLRLARRFLEEASQVEYFHQAPKREWGPTLAFDTIGRFGDRSDLDTLRRLGRDHPYSAFALAALKALDGATQGG
ncbi:NERD domain-containing protein [Methylocystis iwaonis]|uniref:NERD domain-containing protein n=1 Tax=Methylocystis iwaonis TaxID=2885079 RepID=UPI002E7BDD96|nr:NERD domain-containing protein [Methylocystis iwaonis]